MALAANFFDLNRADALLKCLLETGCKFVQQSVAQKMLGIIFRKTLFSRIYFVFLEKCARTIDAPRMTAENLMHIYF